MAVERPAVTGGHRRRQYGLSLIELMIALTISLTIVAAAGGIYLQSARTSTEDDQFGRMQENARFALAQIAADLKLAGFIGEFSTPNAPTTGLNSPSDCGAGLFTNTTPLLYNDNSVSTPSAPPLFDTTACTAAILQTTDGNGKTLDIPANTDQLFIQRTSTTGLTAGQKATSVYLRTNGTTATFELGATALPPGYVDWEYLPRIYFLRNSYPDTSAPTRAVPQLCRADLAAAVGISASFNQVGQYDCLADGVEQMHVEFGIDTDADPDATANIYISNPTAAQMDTAVSARIYLLVRSSDMLPLPYSNTKTYQLGSLAVAANNDRYYRTVFSTTVRMRNPSTRVLFLH